jgi:GNAT superfamily N-acetyltransferase
MTVEPSEESVTFRPATNTDEEFMLELYQSSRGDDLRGLDWEESRISEFLRFQHEAQQQFYQNDNQEAVDEIVMVEGQPVGRLIVERREHEMRCIDLAIMPAHRSAGLGTFLIRKLQDEARELKRPLRLQVIRFSQAVNLFERLGFVRTSETGTHFQMEWRPPR